jgi:hypothetical protein
LQDDAEQGFARRLIRRDGPAEIFPLRTLRAPRVAHLAAEQTELSLYPAGLVAEFGKHSMKGQRYSRRQSIEVASVRWIHMPEHTGFIMTKRKPGRPVEVFSG